MFAANVATGWVMGAVEMGTDKELEYQNFNTEDGKYRMYYGMLPDSSLEMYERDEPVDIVCERRKPNCDVIISIVLGRYERFDMTM